MNQLLKVGAIYIVTSVLVGCFPSQRLYKVDSCHPEDGCGPLMLNSELALVQEPSGNKWRLWEKTPGGIISETCIGTIVSDEFSCNKCGEGDTDFFLIKKASSSDCGFRACMEFIAQGRSCPNDGSGKGGHD